MKLTRILILTSSHLLLAGIGFAMGIYALPIITAPEAPSRAVVNAASASAQFSGEFRRDLSGSDALHWGEGTVSVGADAISLVGQLAPGPDYKLYLAQEFVETEADFERVKPAMVRVADVKTFENFLVSVPASVDVAKYNTVIVWCESFGQFITAARYQ